MFCLLVFYTYSQYFSCELKHLIFRSYKMVTRFLSPCLVYIVFNGGIFCETASIFRQWLAVDPSDVINLRCAATPEEMAVTISKLVDLLNQEVVIGMYAKSKMEVYGCYFNATKSGLVDLENLSGGQVYLLGKHSV